ncbi:YheU family protein [Pokkaliibacter sp. MBI-7]|uniref:YheU family protein n=1 Tax=Pokkaliibacter sp. MBI-7 TaxID=3040600 RepID=UPI00244CF004|nr:YheU family protein [Pokkaliibacter sp. MBI-7]MDH2431613.1 YheU family protein [Pokkaliibacter sp. MBI-7]
MIVPWQSLSAEALQGIIEEFVSRSGTDYGEYEFSLADKVAQIKRALNEGSVLIVWSELTQQVNLMSREEWSRNASTISAANDADDQ